MTDRRSFLAAFAAAPVMAHLPFEPAGPGSRPAASSEWDMSWLDKLTTNVINLLPFVRSLPKHLIRNFLTTENFYKYFLFT